MSLTCSPVSRFTQDVDTSKCAAASGGQRIAEELLRQATLTLENRQRGEKLYLQKQWHEQGERGVQHHCLQRSLLQQQ